MQLRLKDGVTLAENAAIFFLLSGVNEAFDDMESVTTITSGTDGVHSPTSLHPKGRAFDFRTKHLGQFEKEAVFETTKAILGKDYDVILESDHLHVEWDPK